jgi:hypothetical protein
VVLLLSILCGESCFLVSGCVGNICDMAGSDEDRGGSTRPGVDDWEWSSAGQVLGGRMIERSSDAVSCLHHAQGD